MQKQRFWDADLIELVKEWGRDMSTFFYTFLMFVGLSMPVVIPALVLWYLFSINWNGSP